MPLLKQLKQSVIRLLESRGYCVSFGEPATLAGIISAFDKGDFFFVQIGAYDGVKDDPIRQFVRDRRWSGLLVEPQPLAFEQLKRNYADIPGLKFENAAIAPRDGVLPFHTLKPEHASLFHGDPATLASLDAGHILKHLSQPLSAAEALITTNVPCLSFDGLIEKHGIHRIDLLQIDAEGLDADIIRAIDFSKVKPSIIRFEHANLSATGKSECMALLLSHDYKLVMGAYDITAFQSRWMYD